MADRNLRRGAMEVKTVARVDRHRRVMVGSLLLAPFICSRVHAEEIIELEWSDLLPRTGQTVRDRIWGLIEHDQAPRVSQQPESEGVRTDWNGKKVTLPGYVVPVDYSGTGVTAFILVPFVGACIHVPPPPPNQLVFVTTSKPYESKGLFEPVKVTGMFGTASTSTQLAEIGYALSAERIEPYA